MIQNHVLKVYQMIQYHINFDIGPRYKTLTRSEHRGYSRHLGFRPINQLVTYVFD